MTPTTKLRFIERPIYKTENTAQIVRILQQWWEEKQSMNMGWGEITIGETKGEWRDIPLEKETHD